MCGVRSAPVLAGLSPNSAARFADEMGFALAQVVEVESFKKMTKFSKEDKVRAEASWRQHILAHLMDANVDVQKDALRRLEGAVVDLSFSPDGCDIILKAIEVARRHSCLESLISELHGNVRSLVHSENGSDVLTKCLETLDVATTCFIGHELLGIAVPTALSENGYNVICHILEYQPPEQTRALVDELRVQEETLRYDVLGSIVLDILNDVE